MMLVRCPVCDLPLQPVRRLSVGEPQQQFNLPPGWDCPLGHAESVPPPEYEHARISRLIDDITATLDKLRDGIPLTDPPTGRTPDDTD